MQCSPDVADGLGDISTSSRTFSFRRATPLKIILNFVGFSRHKYVFPFRLEIYLHPIRIWSKHLIGCCHTLWRDASVSVRRGGPPCKCRIITIYFPLCVMTVTSWNWWTCSLRISGCGVARRYVAGLSLCIYADARVYALIVFSHSPHIRVIVYAAHLYHLIPFPSLYRSTVFLVQARLVARTTRMVLRLCCRWGRNFAGCGREGGQWHSDARH